MAYSSWQKFIFFVKWKAKQFFFDVHPLACQLKCIEQYRSNLFQKVATITENIAKLFLFFAKNKQIGGNYEKTHIFISIERIKQMKFCL